MIPVTYMLSHKAALLYQKTAWAAMTFLAPFLLFGLGAMGNVLVHQRFEAEGSGARAFGYLIVLLNILAFLVPFALQAIFRTRYAGYQSKGVGETS